MLFRSTAGGTCTYRGVTISNFVQGNLLGTSQVNMFGGPSPLATNFTFSIQDASTAFTGTTAWSYTISHSAYKFVDVTPGMTSSTNSGNNSATFTVASSGAPNAVATYVPVNTVTGPPQLYSGTVTSSNVSATLAVTTGSITANTTSFTFASTTSTPAPLPLLGAGAAFGFARRMRKRISYC